ncbi:hypothetical protein J7907_25490, partial [Vibrio parahaemolyticus]|nr:hypothetical protein [Vibrio parahaemolyticus]
QEREQRIEINREKLDKLNSKIREYREKKYRDVSPETLEMEKELDNLCVFDFDTDVAVRMHNLEADNELLPKYISTLQRLQNNDGKQLLCKMK